MRPLNRELEQVVNVGRFRLKSTSVDDQCKQTGID
jgi:hypothetical protein